MQENDFLFLFHNLGTALWNSALEKFAHINFEQGRGRIVVIKFGAMWIQYFRDVSLPVARVVA